MQIPRLTDEQIATFASLYRDGIITTSADCTPHEWHVRFGGWGMRGNTLREMHPGEEDVGVAYHFTRVLDWNELGAFRVKMPDGDNSPFLLSREDWDRVKAAI